jgi:DNA-directed RNA polymerase specialized sigma24 family protein
MSKHLVLRQSELEALLAWLAPSRDQAGEKYEIIRLRLLRYFQGHHCIPPDEHVDETIDRVARRVAAGERIQSADPIRYCYGVARNVFLEYLKHQAALPQRGDMFSLPDSAPSPDPLCLNSCLNALTPRGRELLEAYYLDSREGLAEREGITPNALRIRVFKEKQKLRSCLMRCLQQNPH